MKQKLLVVLLALMVIFACSACSVDEQAPDEPGDITGITLTEVGILSWNAYKGANSYRLVIGMNSMVYSEPSCNLNEFELDDGDYTVGIFANKDESEFDLAFGELEFSYYDGIYSSATVEPEPDPEDKLDTPVLDFNKNTISWNRVSGAIGYKLSINEAEHQIQASETSYIIENIEVGTYKVKLIALAEEESNNSDACENEFAFDMFATGNGTKETPYEIVTGEHFSNISYFSEKNFRISEHHQLNGAQVQQIGGFSGTLDGDGQIVSDLTVMGEDMVAVPMFDTVEQGGTVQDLELQISEVASDVIASYNYGTLTGLSVSFDGTKAEGYGYSLLAVANYGKISDSEVKGSATVPVYVVAGNQQKSLENSERIAGLIQNVAAEINIRMQADRMSSFGFSGIICQSNYGRIEDSRAKGLVEINCAATGNSISGTGPVYIGGFAGDNRGIITRSESSVNLSLYFGGLKYYKIAAGEFAGRNASGGEITESRSAGSVSMRLLSGFNQMELGGFVGVNEGSLSSCSAEGRVTLSMESSSSPIDWSISSIYVGGLVGTNSQIGSSSVSGIISDSFVRNAPITENFGGEDEESGNIVGNVINDAICETSYAMDYNNITLSDKWLTFVDSAPALKVFAEDTPVITQKVTPVLDKGVVSWAAQSQAEYYLVRLDDGEAVKTEALSVDLKTYTWSGTGLHTLYVMVCNDDYAKGEWAEMEFNVYSFSVKSDGIEKTRLYQVEGAQISLAQYLYPKEGYTATGFKDAEGNDYQKDGNAVLTGDLELSVQYTVNPYTVHYYTMNPDGSWVKIESKTFDFGTELIYPEPKVEGWDPDGYKFAGWYLDEGLQTENSYITVPAKELSLYAKFIRNEFSLIVYTNNEESEQTISVPYDTLVTAEYLNQKLGEVTYFGYSFAGWYADETLNTPFAEFRMGVQTVQIYGKWSLNSYEITVDAQDGSYDGDIPSAFTVEDGSLVLPAAEKYGYTFHGWSVNGGDDGLFEIDCGAYAENIYLCAIFTPNTYRVEYDYGGGKVSQEESYTVTLHSDGTFRLPPDKSWEITVDKDNPLTVPVNYGSVVGAYYTWHTDENCETEPYDFSVPVTEDLHLYCKRHTSPYSQDAVNYGTSTGYYRTAGTFTTTQYYVIDGSKREYTVGSVLSFRTGSFVPYTVKAVNTVIYVYESALSYSAFEGAGVYTDSNGRGQYVAEIEKTFDVGTVIKVQTTFTVQERSGSGITDFDTFMSDINRQIKLEINGENGTTQGVSEWRYNNIVFGDSFGKLPVTERFGYDFVGWMYDGKLYTAQSCMDIASDITLLAKYNLIYSYVQYELYGGINNADNPARYSVEDGKITLSPATKDGYRFMGWYLDEAYSQEISSFGYATIPDGLTIYARFEKLYNVSYVLPDYAAAMETDTRIASEYFVPEWLEDVADADSEYRFAGWYADADYTALVTAISDRAEDVVLYAKFVPLYHVTAHTDGGELTASIPKYTAEDEVELNRIEAKKDNYIFLGWYSDAEFQTKIETIPAGTTYNVEIYAKYDRCTDGLVFTLREDNSGYVVSAGSTGLGEADVVIPAQYNGLPVLSVGSFANRSEIRSLSVPEGVTEILAGAFLNCTGLQTFEVPGNVVFIGEGAFSGCSGLQTLSIPFVGQTEQDVLPFGTIFGGDAYSGGTRTEQSYSNDSGNYNKVYYIPDALKNVTIGCGEISDGAFRNCAAIETITLNDGIVFVGAEAFRNAAMLESVVMRGVTHVGDYAFAGCVSMREYAAGQNLIELGEGAFEGCVALGSVDLGTVQVLGVRTFAGCSALKTVVVPATVTELPLGVFPGLEEVVLEAALIVSDGAFENAGGLIIRVDALDVWCSMQFANAQCNPLSAGATLLIGGEALPAQLTIDSAIQKIGAYVFFGQNFTEINVQGVSEIGDGAFADNQLLVSATIHSDAVGFGIFEGCNALESLEFETAFSTLAYCFGAEDATAEWNKIPTALTEFTLLSGTSIAPYAFYQSSVKQINLPSTITEIGSYAFYGTKISEWIFPENVKSIGTQALGGSAYVSTVDFSHMTGIEKGVLAGSQGVTSLTVPFIGASMADAKKMTQNIGFFFARSSSTDGRNDIPTRIQTIVVLGGGEIDASVFTGCTFSSVKNLVLRDVNVLAGALTGFSHLETLEVPYAGDYTSVVNSLDAITYAEYKPFGALFGETSFSNSTAITQRIRTYQNSSWYNSDKTFYVPNFLQQITIGKEVYQYSFYNYINGYYSIEFVIGDEVEEIGDYAFYGCTIMQTVTIGKNVKSIGSRAFSGCTNATQINFACTMEQLFDIVFGDSWISRTIAMTVGGESIGNSIEVPASVAEVRMDAFDCVSGITEIVLPADVVKVLSGLSQTEGVSVYYGGTIGQWMQIEFAEPLAKSFTLYCQGALVEEIDVPDTLLAVSDYAFYGCDGLKSVIFSENSALQSIGISAFENCVNLTTVTLPVGMSQLTEIKSRAFFDCTALTEVQIPSSVVSLGDYVFRGCSSLQTVVFGAESRLTAIPDYAFNRCTSLTQIELPFGVTSIGRFAFYGDSLLEEVTFVGNEGANALTTIGASAFEDCNRLASFVLSESMGTIGTDAFRGCSSLAIVYNYSSITLIKGSSSYGYIAFYATEILVKEIAV